MKKQKYHDHGQNGDQNPKPNAGRQPGDHTDRDSLKEKLKRTEIEDEAEDEKDEEAEKSGSTIDEKIVNKSDSLSENRKNIGGKGKKKIVNRKG